jgi:GNAT superfamily N-acetyltransferase
MLYILASFLFIVIVVILGVFYYRRSQFVPKIEKISPSVRLGVEQDQISHISQFLSDAFENDPESNVYAEVTSKSSQKDLSLTIKSATSWLVYFNGNIFNYHEQGEIRGVCFTMLLECMDLPLIELFYSGFFKIVFKMYPTKLMYYLSQKRRIQHAKQQIIDRNGWKHFVYIWILGVDPKHQGKGIGGSLLKSVTSTHTNHPLILETSSAKNVEIYSKYGFKVDDQVDFEKFTIWIMTKHVK